MICCFNLRLDIKKEINEFVPKEYWSLDIEGKTKNGEIVIFKFVSFNDEKVDLNSEEDKDFQLSDESLNAIEKIKYGY